MKDSAPKVSDPETLFVPHFNPDEPDPSGWYQEYPNNFVGDAASLNMPLLDIANPAKYGIPDSIIPYLLNGTLTNIPASSFLAANFDSDDTDDCTELIDENLGVGNSKECNLNPFNPDTWETVTLNKNYQYYSDVISEIGPSFSCEMSPLTPLTKDFDKLRTQINNMVASGSTNITEGIMWGWRVLSPTLPFKEWCTVFQRDIQGYRVAV